MTVIASRSLLPEYEVTGHREGASHDTVYGIRAFEITDSEGKVLCSEKNALTGC